MPILDSGPESVIRINGQRFLYFGGNNYLGLANHRFLKKAAITSIERYGLSFSASRETTGTSELHLKLERLLSKFKNTEDTAIFASGYMGNTILLQALRERISAVFMDRSSHPSILDGVPRTISKIFHYDHCSVWHLESLLKTNRREKPLIITDGVFALTGEIAPLDRIYSLAKRYHAIVVVDDAHATGILGQNGRGTPEHFHLDDPAIIYQTETLSKAFGAFGGFIASSADIIDRIRTTSSIYIGSTALPPPVVASGIASVQHLMQHPDLRRKALDHARYLKDEINGMDFQTMCDPTPIIPVLFHTQERADILSRFLYDHGVVAPSVTYPVQTNQYMVRMTISAVHTKSQMDRLLELLKEWRDRHAIDED